MENPELIKGTDCSIKTIYQAAINKLFLVEVTRLFLETTPHVPALVVFWKRLYSWHVSL